MYPIDYRLLTITMMTISEIFFASFPPHKLYFSSHPNALTLFIRHTTDGIRVRQIFFLVKCFLHLIFENLIFHQAHVSVIPGLFCLCGRHEKTIFFLLSYTSFSHVFWSILADLFKIKGRGSGVNTFGTQVTYCS